MHRRILSLFLIGFIGIVFINWGCTKLDTTNLGSDLLPIVDNVNTFADTFFINAQQKEYEDTTYVVNSDDHALGYISNDPLFGKTTANVYLQLKPNTFPFAFGNKDSLIGLGLDSVVLCLFYKGYWGDSNVIQTLQVSEVVDNEFKDSLFKNWRVTATPPITGSVVSPPVNIDIRRLGDYMQYANIKDSVRSQIRIKLNADYASRLFNSDSTSSGSGNHAFFSDSVFRKEFNGLAVKAIGAGNALMYVNLADTNTKLEVHFRVKNAGKIDTIYKSFKLSTNDFGVSVRKSSTANYINRDKSGSPSSIPNGNEIYLQTQPGTYASLTIPQLSGYSNRIIHRAEIIIEQIPDNPYYDSAFVAPNYLYLDLKDTVNVTPVLYKPIYYDLNPNTFYDPDYNTGLPYFPTGGTDFSYFGGYAQRKPGPLGGSIIYYNINISRYIQRMLISQGANYEMRLFPAFDFHYPQYSTAYLPFNNSVALGRVRVGSGTNPNYTMRLRIIYSPIK